MTFSISARCSDTGMLGIAVTSSSICVAARCGVWVQAGAGVVATQNITDPRLGSIGLHLLAEGYCARTVIKELVAAGAYPEVRQLAVVDSDGLTAHHSGSGTLGTHRVVEGPDCVAAGNILASERVPEAMVEAFTGGAGEHLAERLVRGLEAGLAAGGEEGDVRSAGVYVVESHVFATVDLRVDWHDEPIPELRRVWQLYQPQMADYLSRALKPTDAPSYGVPGDP